MIKHTQYTPLKLDDLFFPLHKLHSASVISSLQSHLYFADHWQWQTEVAPMRTLSVRSFLEYPEHKKKMH